LLNRDPNQRLGAEGAQEVKKHPWFKTVNWEAVFEKRIKPPVTLSKKKNQHLPIKLDPKVLGANTGPANASRPGSKYGDIEDDNANVEGWSFINYQNF
jgi:hypothetical protein